MAQWQWNGSRLRLYRDPSRGWLAGVCAGIAAYFGIEPVLVRLGFLASLVFFFLPAAIGYVILAIALPPRPQGLYGSREEEAFWRSAATAPDDTLHTLNRRFGELETRLRSLEGAVTARDFDLRRKFHDLGG
jgi:phage shock protein C